MPPRTIPERATFFAADDCVHRAKSLEGSQRDHAIRVLARFAFSRGRVLARPVLPSDENHKADRPARFSASPLSHPLSTTAEQTIARVN
jgi:hypothetical protein